MEWTQEPAKCSCEKNFKQMNIAQFWIRCLVYKILIRSEEIRFVLIGYERLEELHIIVVIDI
uniref:Uncharacterized protein n=1 Tax=Arundo donax TaxID=35708 RepID=A0A0A9GH32_ARUDO